MKLLLDILLALAGAVLFPQLTGFDAPGFTGGVLPLVLFAALLALLRSTGLKDWRKQLFSHLCGGVFATLTAFGFHLGESGSVPYDAWQLWLTIALYTHLYARALGGLWRLLETTEPNLGAAPKNKALSILDWVLGKWYILLPLLLLCWLPCWLATWPGNFIYDATKEFSQLEKGWMGDFPMLHSVIVVKLLAWSVDATGGINAGIALYTGAQMLLLGAMFTHILVKLRSLGG